MRPKGRFAAPTRCQRPGKTGKQLDREPDAQKDHGRQLHDPRDDDDRDEGDHPGPGEQAKIGPHHPGNGPGGTNDRYRGMPVAQHVQQDGRHTAGHVEDGEPQTAERLLHIVGKNPQHPHVEQKMKPASVQKHIGKKRLVSAGRKPHGHGIGGVGEPGRHHAENIKQFEQGAIRQHLFVEEKQSTDDDHGPGHERRP